MAERLKNTRLAIRRRLLALAREIHAEIVVAAPIDTGTTKTHTLIYGGPQKQVPRAYISRFAKLGRAEAERRGIANADGLSIADGEITIHVNTHYAADLEAGKSRQAPQGFVKISIKKVLSGRRRIGRDMRSYWMRGWAGGGSIAETFGKGRAK